MLAQRYRKASLADAKSSIFLLLLSVFSFFSWWIVCGMSTHWKTPERPKLRRFCDFVSINNSSYSNDMSFILDHECMAVVQRVVFSENGKFLTVYGRSVGRFVVVGAAAR